MSGHLSSRKISVATAIHLTEILCSDDFFGRPAHWVGSVARWIDVKEPRLLGDLDLMFIWDSENEKKCLETQAAYWFGTYKNGNSKTQGVIGSYQVDIHIVHYELFAVAQEFYTLPAPLNLAIRCIANSKGYSFGAKGLRDKTGIFVPCSTREAFYKILGMIPPTMEEMRAAESYDLAKKAKGMEPKERIE